MNGAESLARTLVAAGVETCFANPGTSEMHFVAALDRVAGLRCVLGLAETVVTGCADGYGRVAGRPAATLLHCGPGLANGIANLHNARRADTPIVNVVGDHATWHRPHDPPLAADTEALARVVSRWVRVTSDAGSVGRDAADAVQAACASPGGIATLILPADCAWNEGGTPAAARPVAPRGAVASARIDAIARALRERHASVLLLSGAGLTEAGLRQAQRIAHVTGARLFAPTQVPYIARGRGRPPVDRVPYVVDAALQALGGTRHLVLAGAKAPVAFFGYPGKPSTLWPADCKVHELAAGHEDIVAALEALADALAAPRDLAAPGAATAQLASGPFRPDAFGATFAALLPENAIVAEDAVTSGRALFPPTWAAAPHHWMQVTGGSIGHAFPAATGAALAAPSRKVVCLQADGGGMYSLQALWTQARERLDVVNVVFANRRYAILQGELAAVGAIPGPASSELFDLSRPDLDWVKLAGGMGVEATRVDSLERFGEVFRHACARRGPFLIEFVI
ncbi:MAG TPA: acetolactate synthase large subunit [Usitatibacter sp.]|jgi:acetolactate synthase-1/2/3 large subunit|nr:acetolactate synthase large subunit [Usitatibacter sp.]